MQNLARAQQIADALFNRIEGNINAIELAGRTSDPDQVPTGNTGSLRQFLDWFANRLRVITGMTNWYEAPPVTMKQLYERSLVLAYAAQDQSIPTNRTLTKLQFGSEALDALGEYNPSLNQFTAQATGTYLIETRVTLSSGATSMWVQMHLYRNGSDYKIVHADHDPLPAPKIRYGQSTSATAPKCA